MYYTGGFMEGKRYLSERGVQICCVSEFYVAPPRNAARLMVWGFSKWASGLLSSRRTILGA